MSKKEFKKSTTVELPLSSRDNVSGITRLKVSTIYLGNHPTYKGARYETLVFPYGKNLPFECRMMEVDSIRHSKVNRARVYHAEMASKIASGDVALVYRDGSLRLENVA